MSESSCRFPQRDAGSHDARRGQGFAGGGNASAGCEQVLHGPRPQAGSWDFVIITIRRISVERAACAGFPELDGPGVTNHAIHEFPGLKNRRFVEFPFSRQPNAFAFQDAGPIHDAAPAQFGHVCNENGVGADEATLKFIFLQTGKIRREAEFAKSVMLAVTDGESRKRRQAHSLGDRQMAELPGDLDREKVAIPFDSLKMQRASALLPLGFGREFEGSAREPNGNARAGGVDDGSRGNLCYSRGRLHGNT